MRYSIRPATLDDREAIWPLLVAFHAEAPFANWQPLDRERIFDLMQECLGFGVVYVGVVDERLVGVIAAAPVVHAFSGLSFVEEVVWYVLPAYRFKSRLGPDLLWHVEHWTRQTGLNMLKMVAPAGTKIGRFLTRAGYREIETSFLTLDVRNMRRRRRDDMTTS